MKRFYVYVLLMLFLSACSITGNDFFSPPIQKQDKLTYELSNLDKELVVKVYDLTYINAFSFFIFVRPYLPREASLQVVFDENMLVYSDQKHRVEKFEDIIYFVDNEEFYKSGFDNENIKEFGRLILEQRSIPFFLSDMKASYEDESTSYFIFHRDHNRPGSHGGTFGQHFVKWFSSCMDLMVTGRIDFDAEGEFKNKLASVHIAKSVCVNKMNNFMEHLKIHKNLNKHENTKNLNIKGDTLEKLKEFHPSLFEWKTPQPIHRF